jgi:YD repeat-containing protein
MPKKLKIWNLVFFFSLCISSFGQVPFKKPDLKSYQDVENSKYIGRNISKLWKVKSVLRDVQWNEGTEYYEFDKEGRIILSVSDKFQNGKFSPDTTIFIYATNGLWESKYQLGKMTLRDFEYDEKERLTKIITSNGKTTTYEYMEDNRVAKISYSENYWDEFDYFENGQLKTTRSYKNAVLSQIENYEYESSVIHKVQMNFYDFLPNDTVFEYESRYYSQDTLTTKIISKSEDSSGWVTLTTCIRYNKGKFITLTHCLSNSSPCSYADYIYDDAGNLIEASTYTDSGELKTRSTTLKYEFW